jgi:hypothetical protein
MSRHTKTPLRVSMLAILVGIIGMLLFGGASYATNEAQSSSGIEVASTATTGHQMTAEITRVTSSGTHVTSSVRVDGTWATEKLEIGQSFSVHANVDLKWATNFPFVLDGGERIGDCTVDNTALTCTVDTVPDTMVNKTNVTGHWWSAARIQESAVGKTTAEFILEGKTSTVTFGDSDGDGTCDRDCGPVHYPYASIDNFKAGWVNPDNTVSWMISWVTTPGTEYTIHDESTRLSNVVSCSTDETWNPKTVIKVTATQVNNETIKMMAPEGSKVCVTYTPDPVNPDGAKAVTNVATVNGVRYEKTVEIKADGGTDGDGTTPAPQPTPTPSVTPTPAPSPSPSAPAPTPSTSPTPAPTPTPSAPTPEPTPTPSPSTTPSATPVPTPTPSATPNPTTTPAPVPTPSATLAPARQHKKLAITGASRDAVTSAVALVTLGGFLIWARRRQTAHPEG